MSTRVDLLVIDDNIDDFELIKRTLEKEAQR